MTAKIRSVAVSGTAMSVIDGSGLYQQPEAYTRAGSSDYDAALRASTALHAATGRRMGSGWSYTVELDPGAARIVEEYCRTVGETFAGDRDPENRADGRALIKVADRIVRLFGSELDR